MTDGTETITTLHFVLMAVLALLVVIAIIAGMRKKRARMKAHREVVAHAEEAGVEHEPVPEEASPQTEASSPEPRPLAPPPPSPTSRPVPPSPPTSVPAPAANSDERPVARPLADEPVAAANVVEGSPATIALDADVPEAGGASADGPLTQIKGLGPKVATRLAELGIDRVGQIAALDDAGAAALDAKLGPFTGRMARDRWIEQARFLASGDREGFERVFGRL